MFEGACGLVTLVSSAHLVTLPSGSWPQALLKARYVEREDDGCRIGSLDPESNPCASGNEDCRTRRRPQERLTTASGGIGFARHRDRRELSDITRLRDCGLGEAGRKPASHRPAR
jgi:hypothetical protein